LPRERRHRHRTSGRDQRLPDETLQLTVPGARRMLLLALSAAACTATDARTHAVWNGDSAASLAAVRQLPRCPTLPSPWSGWTAHDLHAFTLRLPPEYHVETGGASTPTLAVSEEHADR
jgi:hypothetical protein